MLFSPPEASSFDLGFIGSYIEVGQELGGKMRITTIGGWDNFHGGRGRIGLSFIESDASGNSLGLDVGIIGYPYSPEHFTPYLGWGLFGGYNYHADKLIGAIYPELGLHFPIVQSLSLNAGTKYYLSTDSNDHAFLLFGARLAWEWE